MSKKKLYFLYGVISAFFLSTSTCYAKSQWADQIDAACGESVANCNSCHSSSAAQTAFFAGGTTLTDYFCPSDPSCTDNDGDTFAVEGGECGQVDCDDSKVAVNPRAAENCNDRIDNDCDGFIDKADSDAVGCPLVCTDNDGDSFAVEGGECGQVDCDDNDAKTNSATEEICGDGIDNNCNNVIDEGCVVKPTCTDNDGDSFTVEGGECGQVDCDDTDADVYPDAVEDCTDSIDNNCNGFVDTLDDNAVNCPLECADNDMDNYSVDGGMCGPLDCNDGDEAVNPGAVEICDDGIDNDCDRSIDEGCDPVCPDADGDGFLDAACGGVDCDDIDAGINPAIVEVCGNGVEENCNGASDDECLSCPDGGILTIRNAEYDFERNKLVLKGRSHIGTTITLVNTETGSVLAENVKVRGGKWRVRVTNLTNTDVPEFVEAINSEGCVADKQVNMKNRPELEEDDAFAIYNEDEDTEDDEDDEDDDDDDDDDDDGGRTFRKWRSWRR